MKARDVMTPDPEVVTPDDTVSRAAQLMREVDVGVIPVVEDTRSRRLRGVITDRDIAVRHVAERHTDDCRVAEHMSEDPARVRPEEDVEEVMRRMQSHQVRRIPVVEDEDRLVGIIAQADIAVDMGDRASVAETVERISEPAEPKR